MKIQIDITNKIIKLEDNVSFGEFVEQIQSMLPNWKEYTLVTGVKTVVKENDFNGILDKISKPYPYKPYPYGGMIYCNGTTIDKDYLHNNIL